ncbi:MAG: RluA family pseudouridine synthase [Verrucomicrobia bacterium]|nr:RluA family pseudouridine synthase [Verrucomicrobiota bacterium]
MPLLDFVANQYELSRKRAKAMIDQRRLFVNGHPVWMARHLLKKGDRVDRVGSASPISSAAITLLYEDRDFLVVDKPAGLLSNGDDSLETRLQAQQANSDLQVAHRLDRESSGCLLVALHAEAMEAVIETFRQHAVQKQYHAIAHGSLDPPEQTITRPMDNRPAVTHVRTLDTTRGASHLLIRTDTGRTHQIRKHLASLGHPLVGDRQYHFRRAPTTLEKQVGRQMLHASELALESPLTTARIRAKASLPRDFRACLKLYRLT